MSELFSGQNRLMVLFFYTGQKSNNSHLKLISILYESSQSKLITWN